MSRNKENWFDFKSIEITPQTVNVKQTIKVEVEVEYIPNKEYPYVYPFRYKK